MERAVRSATQQDYLNKKVVVIDDGSSDHPEEVLEAISDENTIIQSNAYKIDGVLVTYLRNPEPTGPSAARNKAIQAAWSITHFYSMLDADDYYLPGKISKCVEKMLFAPQHIGLVYNDLDIEHIHRGITIREFREPYDRTRLEQECIVSNTPLINKAALAKVGLYEETLRTCEDWDLWLRITEHFTAVHVPEALSVYTVTGENTSFTISNEVWQRNWAIVRQRMLQRNAIHSN